jgi:UrcA family protein
MSFRFTPIRKLALCAVTAAGFAAAAPLTAVHAQPEYDQGSGGEITVYGARHPERAYATGAPIEDVQTSRVVYYGDLDLRSREGRRVLRARIYSAADEACDQLDTMYPAAADDNPPCRETAFRDAMSQTPVGYYQTSWYGY